MKRHYAIMSKIEWCSRIIVGVLFLLSGFAKAVDTGAFANLIAQYGFSSLMWTAPIIVMVEIAAGMCLLLRIYPKQVAIFSVAMVAVFSLAFLYEMLTGNIRECGCFGKLKILELSPIATLIRNAVLLALLFIVYRFSNNKWRAIWQKYAAMATILLIASFLCGQSFTGKAEYRKKHPMFERAVHETKIPEFMPVAPDSIYLLFVFSSRCQSCWSYFDNLKRYYDSGMFDNITVFMGAHDSLQIFYDYFQPTFPLFEMDERELTRIARTAPTMYYIQNDTIKYVIEGSIPTFYMFKQNYLNH